MPELIDRYTYRIIWSEEDQEFVGLCTEFGLLSHLDETPEKALAGIREVVAYAIQLNREDGVPVPGAAIHETLQWQPEHSHPAGVSPGLGDGRRRGRCQPESAGGRTPDFTALGREQGIWIQVRVSIQNADFRFRAD